jgi:hypothetical protein
MLALPLLLVLLLQVKAAKDAEVARSSFQLASDGWQKKAAEGGAPLINFTSLFSGKAVFLKASLAALVSLSDSDSVKPQLRRQQRQAAAAAAAAASGSGKRQRQRQLHKQQQQQQQQQQR